ncbi:hypothetical protein [Caldimonas taiwanensis]|uniref:hypothetical protein n=1 Tax=Caldimonas taiwanensis TaxID=307483 RepID=UPI0007815A22|nr:hypothetical protein [Caldimonas taiwanensis]
MEIKVDQAVVQAAMQEVATKAIEKAIGGYEMQSAIAQTIAGAVTIESIGAAVREGLSKVDTEALTQAIAKEMQRAVVRGVSAVVEHAVVDIVARMRGLYSDSDKDRIRHEIFRKGI